MAQQQQTYLVFGSTGGTGKHFTALALNDNHSVKALVRDPSKLPVTISQNPNLQTCTGSIINISDETLHDLVKDVNLVAIFLGDKDAQSKSPINTIFIKRLVPIMRAHGVKRVLYQAGGFSKPFGGELSWPLWILRKTVARGFEGQHVDNEGVMRYLVEECADIEWIVHRAGIYGDGQSKGTLERCVDSGKVMGSIAPFRDCAAYSYGLVRDDGAVHSVDFSVYGK